MNIYHTLAVLLLLATLCFGPGLAIAISFSQENYQDASLIYIFGFMGAGGAIALTILGNLKKKRDLQKEREFVPIPDYYRKTATNSVDHSASGQTQLKQDQADKNLQTIIRDTAAGDERAILKLVTIVNEKLLNLSTFDTQIARALAKAFFSENTTKQTRKLIWHIKDVVVVDYVYEYEEKLRYKDEDGNDTRLQRIHEKYTFWEYLDASCTRELEQFGREQLGR